MLMTMEKAGRKGRGKGGVWKGFSLFLPCAFDSSDKLWPFSAVGLAVLDTAYVAVEVREGRRMRRNGMHPEEEEDGTYHGEDRGVAAEVAGEPYLLVSKARYHNLEEEGPNVQREMSAFEVRQGMYDA